MHSHWRLISANLLDLNNSSCDLKAMALLDVVSATIFHAEQLLSVQPWLLFGLDTVTSAKKHL